jgi:hypothetical protein
MFSTDPTHLRRYFATLGAAIAVGTFSVAGLFLNLQQDLLVTQSTFEKLTPTARAALMRRQEYLSFGTAILPWFVLVGFLSGIGLSVYGMAGWAKRQKVIDEREDIGLHKERARLTSSAIGKGVLVVLVPDDAEQAQIEKWHERARQMAAEYSSVIGIYLGKHSGFAALPAKDFAAQIGLEAPPAN